MKLSEETFIALFDLKKHGVEIDLTSSKTYKAHWTRKKDDIPPLNSNNKCNGVFVFDIVEENLVWSCKA